MCSGSGLTFRSYRCPTLGDSSERNNRPSEYLYKKVSTIKAAQFNTYPI